MNRSCDEQKYENKVNKRGKKTSKGDGLSFWGINLRCGGKKSAKLNSYEPIGKTLY